MFILAIFIGVYSYSIFFLGIFGLLYKNSIFITSLITVLTYIILQRKSLLNIFKFAVPKQNILLLISLIILQAFVNFIGVLGPELAFDALWYHLTLPKLYVLNHAVYHIQGGLLYYSDMPKLGEMLYVAALTFGNEITAKFIHFLFGLFICLAIYKLTRKYYSQLVSVIAVIIFYSSLVVAWESSTAYVDLIRTYFEILALWSFLNWKETKERKWFILSALMVGFAITTKLLAFGTLLIFSLLLISSRPFHKLRAKILSVITFWLLAIVVPLPWLVFAYVHSGNPFYPFFSPIYTITPEPASLIGIVSNLWTIFVKAADPISPLFIIFIPLIITFFPRMKKEIKLIVFYSLLAIVIWYFTPRTGGGRFMLPYLPAFSIVCAGVIDLFIKSKNRNEIFLSKYLLILLVSISLVTSVYRFMAEKKYLPVIFGQEKKHDFLKDNLNFGFGDFYDIDEYIKIQTKPTDKVLLYGFHNLYYIDFQYIDATWVKTGDNFTYIAVQKGELPQRFKNWQLIYKNDKTMVKLYKNKSSEINTY